MNKLDQYLKRHKIKKIDFIRGFLNDFNFWKETTIYSWINGNRNIPLNGAYCICQYFDGELREEDLIYSTGRLKKIATARSGDKVNKFIINMNDPGRA